MTKKETLEMIKGYVLGEIADLDSDAVVEFCAKEIDALDRRNERAREKAAEKRAAGDALTDAVKAVLTPDFTSIPDILSKLDVDAFEDEITVSKVSYKLSRVLVADGFAKKAEIKVEDANGKKKTVVGYALA